MTPDNVVLDTTTTIQQGILTIALYKSNGQHAKAAQVGEMLLTAMRLYLTTLHADAAECGNSNVVTFKSKQRPWPHYPDGGTAA